MPQPKPNETEDDFLARCMADPEAVTDFPDPAQRYAFCSSQWENRAVTTNAKHKAFLSALAKRVRDRKAASETNGGPRYGYGLGTADRYVRQAIDSEQVVSVSDDILQRAANTATFCTPESQIVASEPVIWTCDTNDDKEVIVTEPADILPKKVKLPDNTLLVLQHIVTTPREDRDEDVLLTEGARLDPKAPLLWQHMHHMPIGKVLTVLEHDKEKLKVASALLDMNELTSDIAKLVAADVLRISHGFRVLDWEERKDDDGNPAYGFLIKQFEIMEVSLVSVPSNVDAEIELFAAGKLASPEFKAHAKSLHDARAVQVPGAEMEPASEPTKSTDEASSGVGETVARGGPDDKHEPAASSAANTEPEEKSGRVLSARMVDRIEQAIEDLAALAATELTRAQQALVNSCRGRLEDCLSEASQNDSEENAVEPVVFGLERDAETETANPSAELTFQQAFAFITVKASNKQRQLCAEAIAKMQEVQAANRLAVAYRKSLGVF